MRVRGHLPSRSPAGAVLPRLLGPLFVFCCLLQRLFSSCLLGALFTVFPAMRRGAQRGRGPRGGAPLGPDGSTPCLPGRWPRAQLGRAGRGQGQPGHWHQWGRGPGECGPRVSETQPPPLWALSADAWPAEIAVRRPRQGEASCGARTGWADAHTGCAVTGGSGQGHRGGDQEQTCLCFRAGGRSDCTRLTGEEEAWDGHGRLRPHLCGCPAASAPAPRAPSLAPKPQVTPRRPCVHTPRAVPASSVLGWGPGAPSPLCWHAGQGRPKERPKAPGPEGQRSGHSSPA